MPVRRPDIGGATLWVGLFVPVDPDRSIGTPDDIPPVEAECRAAPHGCQVEEPDEIADKVVTFVTTVQFMDNTFDVVERNNGL